MAELITQNNFNDIIKIVEKAKNRALQAVNAEMINMFREVGKYLSNLCKNASFGDKVIDEVASYIARNNPEIKDLTAAAFTE